MDPLTACQNDHWTSRDHKVMRAFITFVSYLFDTNAQAERNWLILELQKLAKAKCIRVSFLSGDVHCAAVGVLKTFAKNKGQAKVDPMHDHRYMINVVTSAFNYINFRFH